MKRDGRKRVHLGCYATAVEAAVAYAKHVAAKEEAVAPTVAREAEEMQLHLSLRSCTGYQGVFRLADKARAKPFQAHMWRDGRKVSLGYFATAVEAAIAYAKHVAAEEGGEAEEEEEEEEDGEQQRYSKRPKVDHRHNEQMHPSVSLATTG